MSNKPKIISILLLCCAFLLSGYTACYAEVEPFDMDEVMELEDSQYSINSVEAGQAYDELFSGNASASQALDAYGMYGSGYNDFGYDPYAMDREISNLSEPQLDIYYDNLDLYDDPEVAYGQLPLADTYDWDGQGIIGDAEEFDIHEGDIYDTFAVADDAVNPFVPHSNIGTDAAGFVDSLGILRPDTTLDALELASEGQESALVDITHSWADREKIDAFKRDKLSEEAYKASGATSSFGRWKTEEIIANKDELQKAGAISLFAEDGYGEVKVGNFPSESDWKKEDVYLIYDPLGQGKEIYSGDPPGVIAKLPLYPENANVPLNEEFIPSFVDGLYLKYDDFNSAGEQRHEYGTGAQIAPGLTLTSKHVVHPITDTSAVDAENITSVMEKIDTHLMPSDVITKFPKGGDPVSYKFNDVYSDINDHPKYDTSILTLKNGQDINTPLVFVTPLAQAPNEGDALTFYNREGVYAIGEKLLYLEKDSIQKNKVVKASFENDPNLFEVDYSSFRGASGSPIYSSDSKGRALVSGVAAVGLYEEDNASGIGIMPSDSTLFVSPVPIREQLEEIAQEYAYPTTKTWAEAVKEKWDDRFTGAESVDVYKTTYDVDGSRRDWYHASMPDGGTVTGDFLYPRTEDYTRER